VYAHPRRLRPDSEGDGRVPGPNTGPTDANRVPGHDGHSLSD
jgi:hypothetical protein